MKFDMTEEMNRQLLDAMRAEVYPKFARQESILDRQYADCLAEMSERNLVGDEEGFQHAVKKRKAVDVAIAQMDTEKFMQCEAFCANWKQRHRGL